MPNYIYAPNPGDSVDAGAARSVGQATFLRHINDLGIGQLSHVAERLRAIRCKWSDIKYHRELEVITIGADVRQGCTRASFETASAVAIRRSDFTSATGQPAQLEQPLPQPLDGRAAVGVSKVPIRCVVADCCGRKKCFATRVRAPATTLGARCCTARHAAKLPMAIRAMASRVLMRPVPC